MSATNDAVEKISGVIRSLISAFTGDEAERIPHTPPDWQTAEDKVRAARRMDLLRRRMAHCDRMTPAPKLPADDGSKDDLPDKRKIDSPP